MNTSTDTSTVIVSTPVIATDGTVTGPTVPTTKTFNLVATAREAVAAFAAIAEAECDGLVAAWNAGVAYRWAIDNGTKGADFIAAVLTADVDGYAARRKASSKSTWSKYGKIVKTWDTFADMEAAVHADPTATMSIESAYLLAVRLSDSGKGERKASPACRIDQGVSVDVVADAILNALTAEQVDALVAALSVGHLSAAA